MEKYLLYFKNHYPASTVNDYYKLIYQSVFGVGHIIGDRLSATKYLQSEINNMQLLDTYEPLYEYISNEYVRINLRPYCMFNLSLDKLLDGLINCPNNGTIQLLEERFDSLKCLIDKKLINIPLDDVDKLIESFQKNYQAIHHSPQYRATYSPHYRVVSSSFITDEHRLLNFQGFINSLQGRHIVAIDGKCCTGKSYLSSKSNMSVIHIDDFFPDNSLDVIQVPMVLKAIQSISYEHDFTYPVYNCSNKTYSNKIMNKASDIVLIEGVYSMLPALRTNYDKLVLFKSSYLDRMKRLKKRSSQAILEKFLDKWIPAEDKYFDIMKLESIVDIII